MIQNKDIEDIFSNQLKRISDESLREKVTNAWVAGCKAGGWENIDEIKKIPFTLLTNAYGINLIEHTIAVTKGACALAEAQQNTCNSLPYKINMDRLIAGGLLHDVGKLIEIEKEGSGNFKKSYKGKCARHPISGAILASQAGLPDEIINIIACHAREGEGRPQVVETVFIHQADFACFNPLVMLADGKLIM
jgi:putative nucleotidyltransferase with HDIG domain